MALPSIISKIQELIKEEKANAMKKTEEARKKKADQTSQDIKHAQDVGDEQAQDDALSRTVDDYNS